MGNPFVPFSNTDADIIYGDYRYARNTKTHDTINHYERDHGKGYASSNKEDAKLILDSKIYDITSNLPILISVAKRKIENELRFKLLKKITQGWSIVAAGLKDIFGNYANNNYEITDVTQLYTYGYLFFYGIGFGFPSLLGNPDPPPIKCGVDNYHSLLEKYGISGDKLNLVSQFGVKSARSLIKEFSTFLQLELSCILDEANNYLEAADVKWSLDNLLAAYNSRLDIESNNSQY